MTSRNPKRPAGTSKTRRPSGTRNKDAPADRSAPSPRPRPGAKPSSAARSGPAAGSGPAAKAGPAAKSRAGHAPKARPPRHERDDRARAAPPQIQPHEVGPALRQARAKRVAAGLPTPGVDEIYRLAHAEHDNLAGLFLDVWGDTVLIRVRDPLWHDGDRRHALVSALQTEGFTELRWLIDHGARHDGPLHQEETERWNVDTERRGIGPAALHYEARELGLRYGIRLDEPFNPGLFHDMREVRRALRARWTGKRIANLFCYTGAFSVALAHANTVVNVDSSARYLAWAEENHQRNGLTATFVRDDAFAWLKAAKAAGEKYDAVIVDPPVFSRGKKGHSRAFSLRKDLGSLIEDAMSITAPGGELFVSTNYEALSQSAFRTLVVGIARDRRRWLETPWASPVDFPAPADTFHLKTALLVPDAGRGQATRAAKPPKGRPPRAT